jgi:hypothetical protein
MSTYRLDPAGIVEAQSRRLDDGTALHEVVAELRVPGASHAGVSVHAEPARPGDNAPALTDGALSALDTDVLLIDVEPCELAGEPAVRTLLLVQLGGVATVVLEQWRLVARGARWLVTVTADLAAWARFAAALRAVVATIEIEP